MKKILSIAGAIALAASLFVACSSEAADDGRNSYIDTYSLDAVDITVKAYPGFNYVSWGQNKKGGTVKVLRDDGLDVSAAASAGATATPVAGGTYFYIDTNVKGGVKYTYTATVSAAGTEVKSANDGGKTTATTYNNEYKTYYAVTGAQKSASVTAIAPDYYDAKGNLTTALDLTNCQNAGDKKYVISDKNLIYKKVTDEIGDDNLYVSFPTKAYLKYDVIFYKGNSFDTYYAQGSSSDFGKKNNGGFTQINVSPNFYKMDSTTNKSINLSTLGAGTWKAVVKVSAGDYVPSYVFAKDTVTIDAVDTNGGNTSIVDINASSTGNQSGYIDSGKTIRVIWKAAKNSNNKAWAADKYKVYVADGVNKNAAVYTALDATLIKTDSQKTEPVYYIDYTVTDNTAPYTFWVVLSDNGKLESTVPSVTVAKYAKLDSVANVTTSAVFTELDKNGVNDDAVITFTLPAGVKVSSVKYKVLDKKDNATYTAEDLLLDSELAKAATLPSANDYTTVAAAAKDIELDSKVVFLYTLEQAGKANGIYTAVTTDIPATPAVNEGVSNATVSIDLGEFTFAFADGSDATNSYKGKFTIVPATTANADKDANYYANQNFTYTIAYARLEDGVSYAGITDWKSASVTIKFDTATQTWKGESASDIDFASLLKKASKNDLNETSGKPQDGNSTGRIVFKYTKTLKAESAKGASATNFATQDMVKAE